MTWKRPEYKDIKKELPPVGEWVQVMPYREQVQLDKYTCFTFKKKNILLN